MQDIITTFKMDTIAYLELSMFLDGDTYPRMARFPLTFNAPPMGGKFIIAPKTGTSVSTAFTFTAKGWTDTDNPIKYRYLLYLDESSYHNDVRLGFHGNVYDISSFNSNPEYTTQLPSGKLIILC